jgi:hypothetical protein
VDAKVLMNASSAWSAIAIGEAVPDRAGLWCGSWLDHQACRRRFLTRSRAWACACGKLGSSRADATCAPDHCTHLPTTIYHGCGSQCSITCHLRPSADLGIALLLYQLIVTIWLARRCVLEPFIPSRNLLSSWRIELTGRPRCFAYWQEFSKVRWVQCFCYTMQCC